MFCTLTNFDKVPYNIPQRAGNSDFSSRVDSIEKDHLVKLLGYDLYLDFIAGLAALSEWDVAVATVINTNYAYGNDVWKALTVQTGTAPIAGADWELVEEDNKWLVLKNGTIYEYSGYKYQWKGMDDLLTPLVYSVWTSENIQNNTGIGVTESKHENADKVSPARDIVRSWNDYARKAGNCSDDYHTLYSYLVINYEALYANWLWKGPRLKNIMGI